MKIICFQTVRILLFGIFFQNILFSATGDYRSKATGLWSATASWERYNGTAWVTATQAPTSLDGVITILNTHIITVDVSVTVDQVVVNTGGSLHVKSNAIVDVADGSGIDLSVSGTVQIESTGGEVTVASGTISFLSGSLYEHKCNASSIPIASWDANSTCAISGITTTALPVASTNQNFGNFTWTCSNSVMQDFQSVHIQGNLTFSGSNLRIACLNTGQNLTIDGNLTLSNGTFDLGYNDHGIVQLILNGDLTHNSGTFTRTYTTSTVNIVFNKSGSQNCRINYGAIINTYFNWTINSGSTVEYLTSYSEDWSVATGRTFTLNGTLNCNGRYLTGTGNFTSASGSTLKVYDGFGITTSGASGQIQVSGTRTYNAAANYIYTGSSISQGGAALINAANLTIDASGYTLALSSNLSVSGNVNLTDGILNLSDKTLTLGSTATLNETSVNYATTVTTGQITTTRTITSPSSQNIGGMGLLLTSAANLGSTTLERHHNAVTANGHTGIKRWYKITPTNNTGLNASIVFPYYDHELNGQTEGTFKIYKSENNSTWQSIGSIVDPPNNTVTSTGINTFSYFTVSNDANALPVELSSFTVNIVHNNAALCWMTATEVNNNGFEIERLIVSEKKSSLVYARDEKWCKIGFVEGNGTTNAPKEYSFIDKNIASGKYSYRLKQIDRDGKFEYSKEVEITVNNVPKEFSLEQNYPNPFNPTTAINYQLSAGGFTTLKVFDAIGREAATLVNEVKEAGEYITQFNGTNLAGGVYFIKLQSGEKVQLKKMLLLK
jgi:hypothetical protein